ncbi:hypothetical protein EYF80_016165 [Liparis tanakae]|uniref:Uncharacterized protein n=1 Tax=Liparis tanakae TaxID=230148 RepID=A0A4Z2I6W7_9TELE|nr:hypothetical protein EYF80_016165 [Liparis tanakae]
MSMNAVGPSTASIWWRLSWPGERTQGPLSSVYSSLEPSKERRRAPIWAGGSAGAAAACVPPAGRSGRSKQRILTLPYRTLSMPCIPGWSCSGMEAPLFSRNTPMLNWSVSQMCM